MANEFAGTGAYKATSNKGERVVEGVMVFGGGEFDALRVKGICTSEGPIQAGRLDVNGVFTAQGNVHADDFICEGIVTIEGNLRVKKANIEGVTTVQGDKVEADRIRCGGVLTVGNQLSADLIEADGFINAREIVGDRIYIRSYRRGGIFNVLTKVREAFTDLDYSKIDLIEATTIELRGVRAKSVNGQDIKIGPYCVIDRVDCSGLLEIDPGAKVGEVIQA